MSDEPADLVLVFETDDPAVLPVAKSLLESSGLPHVLQGEGAFGQLPVSHIGGPFAAKGMAVRFLVPAENAEEARELFSEIEPDDVDPEADDEELDDFEEFDDFEELDDEDELGGRRFRDDELDEAEDDD
jgi:hypothetical protein